MPVEVLKRFDPRIKSTKCKDAIKDEISVVMEREASEYIENSKSPPPASILGGRFLLAIKQPRKWSNDTKQNVSFKGTNRKKRNTLYIYKNVTNKNSTIFVSIYVTYKLKIWNQDLTKAYIQAQNLERDVYVLPYTQFGSPENIILKPLKPLSK